MSFILFDDASSETLRPFTLTRPAGDIRIGILTIAEKWANYLRQDFSWQTASWLRQLFPAGTRQPGLFINGSVCPDEQLVEAVTALTAGQALVSGNHLLAAYPLNGRFSAGLEGLTLQHYPAPFTKLTYPEDIFRMNDSELRNDFRLLTRNRSSAALDASNTMLGTDFFAEEGVEAVCSTFNTLTGPIYLAAGSQVWEGTHIRGPFSLGEQSQVKMGAKIYGATTIGAYCRVGGEISNSVVFNYSSKGHEGFLGNSVIGEWCNIGAGSNNSNLKNNYSEVKLWDAQQGAFRATGLQFCGLMMGDHTKCGITTQFNTGTVTGVGANIYGSGYLPKFIPGFSWGGAERMEPYQLDKFLETTARVFERRNRQLTLQEKAMLEYIYHLPGNFNREK